MSSDNTSLRISAYTAIAQSVLKLFKTDPILRLLHYLEPKIFPCPVDMDETRYSIESLKTHNTDLFMDMNYHVRRVDIQLHKLKMSHARLEGQVDKLDGKVDKLDGKVDKLDGKVNKLRKDIEALREHFDALREHFDGLREHFDGKLDELRQDFATHAEDASVRHEELLRMITNLGPQPAHISHQSDEAHGQA